MCSGTGGFKPPINRAKPVDLPLSVKLKPWVQRVDNLN